MRSLILTASALSLVAGCNAAGSEAVQRELEKLQGTWIGVSYTDAQRTIDGRDMSMSLVVDGDHFTVHFGDQVIAQGRLGLDPNHNPKAIDFLEEKHTGTGIYEMYDDTLRLCYDPVGDERPTRLVVKPGSNFRLFVLQRQKGAPG
jgi:uncharacterized protein (TIGR03067 family)